MIQIIVIKIFLEMLPSRIIPIFHMWKLEFEQLVKSFIKLRGRLSKCSQSRKHNDCNLKGAYCKESYPGKHMSIIIFS